jgi:hypothetical protein
MTKRKRTIRRAEDREHEKIRRDLEKLALLAPGGSADRAILVTSAAEIEVSVTAMPCPLCQGALRLEEHAAETVGGLRVRICRVVCSVCRARRAIYFRLAGAMLN